MKKFNIIIGKRNRDKNIILLLHNLNLANQDKKYDVNIYIGEDIEENINKFDYSRYRNLKIEHLYVPNLHQAKGSFCKANILNNLLQKMRQDYDFICVADTDMVYRNDFFDLVSGILKVGDAMETCLFSLGLYTDATTDYRKIHENNLDYDAIVRSTNHKAWTAGHSQISITRKYHEHIKRTLNIRSIYDTVSLGYDFIGYGGEDTLVKWILQSSKIKIVKLPNAWVHVWHEIEEANKILIRQNRNLAKLSLEEAIRRLKLGGFYESRYLKKLKNIVKFPSVQPNAWR